MTKSLFVVLSWWVFLVPVGLKAQAVRSTEVADVVASIRRGRASAAADFLASKGGRVSGSDLVAFGDSLVGIASSYRSGDPRAALRAATAALTAISLAADPNRGTPFPHAFESLVRIYEGSPEVGIQGTALTLIGSLPSNRQGVQFLSKVAVMTGGAMPSIAVKVLAQEAGQAGLNELRRLYQTDAVSDSNAKEVLAGIAHRQGWRKNRGEAGRPGGWRAVSGLFGPEVANVK